MAAAPSQAHLQGTQSQQHKNQPAKELAFLLGLGNSL
jgi:hypothetical protein